ncbi:MAG: 5-dehydro-4-deoxyglucarate dehydratase [Candidatus Dormiibacterota bacterium]
MALTPTALASRLEGLLAFPVTPFTADGDLNLDAFRNQVDLLLGAGAIAVFPACGTGEFAALSREEYGRLLDACVRHVDGRAPVVAGVGYGTAPASALAQLATRAGVDGLLVLPPYLSVGAADGLEAHYRAVARSTPLGVILYQRDQVVFEPESVARLAAEPNVIGVKDGIGQVERLLDIRRATGGNLLLLNGMPTAEIHAQALTFCGARGYSSAILNFLPEVAVPFYAAAREGDTATMHALLDTAILPFAAIRRRRPGYAVTLVKAAARLRGLPVGRVRPPLSEIGAQDERDLGALLAGLGFDGPLAAAHD